MYDLVCTWQIWNTHVGPMACVLGQSADQVLAWLVYDEHTYEHLTSIFEVLSKITILLEFMTRSKPYELF